jgi:phosphoribosylformylglycinamidine cyclo-ligase
MSDEPKPSLTYRDAGLDLALYAQTLAGIAPLLKRTHTPRVLPAPFPSRPGEGKGGGGGFASLFRLNASSRRFGLFARNYRDPVLVTCTDGVGTKLKVAALMGKHDTVGIDLVAMSVNDALCTGGEPLLFLDYLAMPKDDPALACALVKGISDGCLEADCALVGGETAILPDFYQPGDYDLAGFCVGVVERSQIVDGRAIRPGDRVLGLASTGLHSNGYSLARKVFFELARWDVNTLVPDVDRPLGELLLEPTRIYVRPVKDVLRHYPVKKRVVRGLAHITGEGLPGNIPRILPPGCRAVLKRGWPVPPLFGWLQKLGGIAQAEMERVFNMGIGFVMIVSPYYAQSIQRRLTDEHHIETFDLGEVQEGEPGVDFVD